MGLKPRGRSSLARRLGGLVLAASPAEIAALATRADVAVRADTLAFLTATGGFDVFAWVAERAADDEACRAAIRQVGRSYLHSTAVIFSAAELIAELDRPRWIPPALLRSFYPVGKTPGGDPLVQLAAGERAGQLGMVDHEVASLLESLPAKLASPDEIIRYCERRGALLVDDDHHDIEAYASALLDRYQEALDSPMIEPENRSSKAWSSDVERRRREARRAAKKAYAASKKEARTAADPAAAAAAARSAFRETLARIDAEARAAIDPS